MITFDCIFFPPNAGRIVVHDVHVIPCAAGKINSRDIERLFGEIFFECHTISIPDTARKIKTPDPKYAYNREAKETLSHAFCGTFEAKREKNDSESLLWPDMRGSDGILAC
ncbi:MAG: hypothetical protein AB2L14_10535 [Candidatus Xenobiia bacterium LiM19]